MCEKTLQVLEEDGLHTRPANRFVQLVKEGSSEVVLTKSGTEVPGRSLLKIMKLGIVKGDTVTLRCEGPDEERVMETLISLLQPRGDEQ